MGSGPRENGRIRGQRSKVLRRGVVGVKMSEELRNSQSMAECPWSGQGNIWKKTIIENDKADVGEMAQLGDRLPCKHGDFRLITRTHVCFPKARDW